MKRASWILVLGVALALALACESDSGGGNGGGGGGGGEADTTEDTSGTPDVAQEADAPFECEITGPEADAIIGEQVDVQVMCTIPPTVIELFVDGASVARSPMVDAATGLATVTWRPEAEGASSLEVSAELGERVATTQAVGVLVDLFAPTVDLDLATFALVSGSISVPVSIVETQLTSVVVQLDGEEIGSYDEAPTSVDLDTATLVDGAHALLVEVTDVAGNVATKATTFIVVNKGEEVQVQYIPSAEVYIPENYMSVEYHTRIQVAAQPGVTRVLTWLTWEGGRDWTMEYSLGQGICPHNGIQYVAEESNSGAILLDLRREDLSAEVLAKFPAEEKDGVTFPYNDNPRTFGAFFGHVAPMDPADHVGESVAIDVHYVLFFE